MLTRISNLFSLYKHIDTGLFVVFHGYQLGKMLASPSESKGQDERFCDFFFSPVIFKVLSSPVTSLWQQIWCEFNHNISTCQEESGVCPLQVTTAEFYVVFRKLSGVYYLSVMLTVSWGEFLPSSPHWHCGCFSSVADSDLNYFVFLFFFYCQTNV